MFTLLCTSHPPCRHRYPYLRTENADQTIQSTRQIFALGPLIVTNNNSPSNPRLGATQGRADVTVMSISGVGRPRAHGPPPLSDSILPIHNLQTLHIAGLVSHKKA
ncbi:hypothetical protein CC2G_011618 [Coprinopsis cinerea AmutBmut pab1-1]|nr:hypothetical protein CC2G_011618 [Coprinopsis cinerea AmutBmut pab1-1]